MYFLREIFLFEIMCLKSVAASVFKVLKFLYWVRGIWLTWHLKFWRDIPKLQTYPPPLMSITPFKWTIYIPSIIYIFGKRCNKGLCQIYTKINAQAIVLVYFIHSCIWSNGLVVKVLDSQSTSPVFKTTGWLQGWLNLSSFWGR